MLKERNLVMKRFMRVVDAMVIVVAFPMAYYLRERFHLFYTFDLFPQIQVVESELVSFERYVMLLILVVPIWIVTLNMLGVYQSIRTRSFFDIIWILFKSTIYTTFIVATFVFTLKVEYVSRVLFAFFAFFTFSLLAIEKWLLLSVIRYIRRKGYNYKRLLIVGSGKRAQNFIKVVEKHPEWGFKIGGIVDDEKGKINQKVMNYDIIGTLDDIANILHRRAIDEVVFVVPRSWLNKIQNSIAICELEGVKARLAVDLFDLEIAHATQTELEGIPLMTFEPVVGHEGQLFIKRTLDILFSAVFIVVLAPVFLVVALLIKLTSKGPVFFVQRRVGRNGRRFILYKFRTMYYGSHKKLAELEKLNELSGPVFKIKNDPRITPAGRLLRKFSIDELPQLFNIFMGHMSLVGPRPPLPREVRKYEPWQRRRLSMHPGLTCLWQVSGRNKIAFEEWIKLDLQYIDNWSLWLDFKIILKTIPVVFFGIGAH